MEMGFRKGMKGTDDVQGAVEYQPCPSPESDLVRYFEPSKVVLKRFLGLAGTVSFILGMIIGTGIFMNPAEVLRASSGSMGIALIVWVLAGFIQANGALGVTELALYYRQSGGAFVYLNDVYGPAVAFVNTFLSASVKTSCSAAVQSFVVVNFLLTPFVGDCDPVPQNGIRAGATVVIMLAVFVNSVSVNWAARTQVFLMFVKVGALLLVIIMGAVMVITSGTDKFTAPFETSGGVFDWKEIPSAFFLAYFAYGGWMHITNVTEEVTQPQKTLIRGMLMSLSCSTILYALANLAYFGVLSPEEMMASDAVAALFAVRVVGVKWSFIIWLCVVLSASGNLNGATFTKSRLYFVAARAKKFPFILSTIHVHRRTPLAALLMTLFPTLVAIWAGDMWSIIKFSVIINQSVNILIILIVPYLRWKRPGRKLAYKAPLPGCLLFIVFNIALLLVTCITNPLYIGTGVAIVVLTLLLYHLYEWTGRSPRAATMAKSMNDFLQKILLSVPQEADTF